MYLDADDDVLIGNGIDALRLRANGHTDHIDGGAGGLFEIVAGGNVRLELVANHQESLGEPAKGFERVYRVIALSEK